MPLRFVSVVHMPITIPGQFLFKGSYFFLKMNQFTWTKTGKEWRIQNVWSTKDDVYLKNRRTLNYECTHLSLPLFDIQCVTSLINIYILIMVMGSNMHAMLQSTSKVYVNVCWNGLLLSLWWCNYPALTLKWPSSGVGWQVSPLSTSRLWKWPDTWW